MGRGCVWAGGLELDVHHCNLDALTLLRFADLESYILAIKVLQAYRLEYHHEHVGLQTDFVNKPDRKIRMKFIPRTS